MVCGVTLPCILLALASQAVDASNADILGAYSYGNGRAYKIEQRGHNLWLVAGVEDRLEGRLTVDGQYYLATMMHPSGSVFGYIRLRKQDAKTMLLSFRQTTSDAWGEESATHNILGTYSYGNDRAYKIEQRGDDLWLVDGMGKDRIEGRLTVDGQYQYHLATMTYLMQPDVVFGYIRLVKQDAKTMLLSFRQRISDAWGDWSSTQATCFENDQKYISPLDMSGESRTVETSAVTCQRRCATVSGCAHFSWWRDGGCHLQDAGSSVQAAPGVTAGPPSCQATCSSYTCETAGWTKKGGSESLTNPTDETCCEAVGVGDTVEFLHNSKRVTGIVKSIWWDYGGYEIAMANGEVVVATSVTVVAKAQIGLGDKVSLGGQEGVVTLDHEDGYVDVEWTTNGHYQKVKASTLTLESKATCGSFQCPDGRPKKDGVETQTEPSAEKCCEASGIAYTSHPGWCLRGSDQDAQQEFKGVSMTVVECKNLCNNDPSCSAAELYTPTGQCSLVNGQQEPAAKGSGNARYMCYVKNKMCYVQCRVYELCAVPCEEVQIGEVSGGGRRLLAADAGLPLLI